MAVSGHFMFFSIYLCVYVCIKDRVLHRLEQRQVLDPPVSISSVLGLSVCSFCQDKVVSAGEIPGFP